MRTTVDIPDPIYRELKARAAQQGTSVKQLILQGVTWTLRPAPPTSPPQHLPEYTVIRSKNPGSLKLGPEGVYGYIPFP